MILLTYLSIPLSVDSLHVLYSNSFNPKHFKYPFQVCDLFSNISYTLSYAIKNSTILMWSNIAFFFLI